MLIEGVALAWVFDKNDDYWNTKMAQVLELVGRLDNKDSPPIMQNSLSWGR